jgi:hypothetical protein
MDALYLKENIGEPLVACITQLALKQPVDPLNFMAGYLHTEADRRDAVKAEQDRLLAAEEAKRAADARVKELEMLKEAGHGKTHGIRLQIALLTPGM